MQKYGQLNLFPVKLQVPIIFTVYLVLVNKCACCSFSVAGVSQELAALPYTFVAHCICTLTVRQLPDVAGLSDCSAQTIRQCRMISTNFLQTTS